MFFVLRQRDGNFYRSAAFSSQHFPRIDSNEANTMDKDRIKGSANQAKGKAKETLGKLTGDAKLESEGKVDQVVGKVQNTFGGIKDKIRETEDAKN